MTERIISYAGVLGLGGLLGIVLKSIFDYQITRKRLLFEARIKAYSEISGRLFNFFLEPDITMLKNDALIWAKITTLISSVALLAEPELFKLLGEFQEKAYEFHVVLGKKDDKASEIIHKSLTNLTPKIFGQMRKELSIGKRTS